MAFDLSAVASGDFSGFSGNEKQDNAPGDDNVSKFLDFLGKAEGADYNTIVGGGKFDSFDDHPRVVGLRTKEGPSTAAGKYQITKTTFDDVAPSLGITDFSPESQDAVALELIRRKGALDDVKNGDFNSAIGKLGGVWASLPSSKYSQPKRSEEWVSQQLAGGQPAKKPSERAITGIAREILGNREAKQEAQRDSAFAEISNQYIPDFGQAYENKKAIENEGILDSISRGFSTTLPQTKQLMSGSLALGADMLGADGVRDWAMEAYKNAEEAAQKYSRSTDSFSQDGSSNLGKFVGYWTGYTSGQLLESIAAAGAGAVIGSTAGGAGAVPAAVAGLIVKQPVRAAIQKQAAALMSKIALAESEKKITKEAAEKIAKEAGDAFIAESMKRAAGKEIGLMAAMGAQNVGMETGEIYGDIYKKAQAEGRDVTSDERLSALGFGIAAGAMETVFDKMNLDAVLGGGAKAAGLKNRAMGFAREAAKAEAREIPTETVQTALERAGKGESVDPFSSKDAANEYLDTIAGTAAGSWIPGLGGLRVSNAKNQLTQPPAQEPNSPLTNAANASQATQPAGTQQDLSQDPLAAITARLSDRSFYQAVREHPNLGPEALSDILATYKVAQNPNLDPMQRSAAIDRLNGFFSLFDNQPNFVPGSGQESNLPAVRTAQPTNVGFVDPAYGAIDGSASVVQDPLALESQRRLGAPAEQLPAPEPRLLPDDRAAAQAKAAYEAEFQDLVKAEQLGASDEELMRRQIRVRNAEARLNEINALIESNREIESQKRREEILNRILDTNPKNPKRAFGNALKAEGYTNTNFTVDEQEKIEKFRQLRDMESESVPSNENEGGDFGLKEKVAPVSAKFQHVADKLNSGWIMPNQHQIAGPNGEIYNLKGNGEKLFAKNLLSKKAKKNGIASVPSDGGTVQRGDGAGSNPVAGSVLESEQPDQRGYEVNAVDTRASDNAVQPAVPVADASASNADVEANIKRGKEAMSRVIANHTDEPHAMQRDGHGWVSFVWGSVGNPSKGFAGGNGVSKIIAKRTAEGADGEAVAMKMVEVIALGDAGEIYGPKGGERFNVNYDNHTAVLSLHRFGQEETWLLTGWDDVVSDDAGAGNATGTYAPEPSGIRMQEGADNLSVSNATSESNETDTALRSSIADAESSTAANPTEAQKEAGNYVKGKFKWNGLTISIETPKGTVRSGKNEDGTTWSVTSPYSYGYFLGTTGADEEHLDVYVGEHPESDQVFVVNQTGVDSTKFDEHKVLIGFNTAQEAKNGYFGAFEDGFAPRVYGSIAGPFSVAEFKEMLPKFERSRPINTNVLEKSDRIVAEEKRKYEETVARAKEKEAERALVPLSEIVVTRSAVLDGEQVEYDQKAEEALKEIDDQLTLGRELLNCVLS